MPTLAFWSYPPQSGQAGGLQTSNESLALALGAYSPPEWTVAHSLARATELRWHLAGVRPETPVIGVERWTVGLLSSMAKARAGAVTYRLLLLADRLASLDADLVFATDVSTTFKAMDRRARVILAPNDFQYLFYPENFTRGQLIQRKWLYRRALDRANLVVVGSQQTFDDLAEHYPEAESKTVLWRFPAPADLRQPSTIEQQMAARLLGPTHGSRATILYPAQFWPHKNHLTLIRAISMLKQEYGVEASLILTGTGKSQQHAAWLCRQERVEDQVLFLGNVPRGLLLALFADAAIVAVPSLFEQASYPLIEAGWFARPILASAIPSLQGELTGHPDALLPPLDPGAWAASLHRALTEDHFRARLVSASKSVLALHSVQRQSEEFWKLALEIRAETAPGRPLS